MQIQLNTDRNVSGPPELVARVEADLQSALDRFSERITRIEVHLSDVNGEGGGNDKRCLLEARLAGRQPLSVSDQAPSVAQALDGAVAKLVRALDSVFGKLEAERRTGGSRAHDAQAT